MNLWLSPVEPHVVGDQPGPSAPKISAHLTTLTRSPRVLWAYRQSSSGSIKVYKASRQVAMLAGQG
jgi:hypothetical protein